MNYNVENSVLERYELGAKEHQPSLCCPTEYDQSYLAVIPEEIIKKKIMDVAILLVMLI